MLFQFFRHLFLWGLLSSSLSAYGVIETYEFENAEQEKRYQHFTEVLRCPKCQNQNLAGSDSPIAADLRRELALQIRNGKVDDEIVDFMVARFGDFVLYDPPFKQNTWLLWLAPAGLLMTGVGSVMWLLRRRRSGAEQAGDDITDMPLQAGSGLSLTQAKWVLLWAAVLVLVISGYLYFVYGASDELAISRLANGFYAEAALASREQREADPALARELLVRLQQAEDKKNRLGQPAADISGSDLQRLYLQASLHVYLSEFEQAVPYYKQYLMVVPSDERVLTEYVQVLYLAAGRQLTERVQFVADRALDLNPHNQEVLSLLAMHHYEQGEFRQAADYWRRVLATLAPGDPGRPLLEKAIAAAEAALKKG